MSDSLVLEMRGIHKRFAGVHALKGANLEVRPNEILGLVGENGAGKSTMMKVLVGLYGQDEGEIRLRGREVRFRDPRDAAESGVGMVFQEQSLLPNLTVAENLFLAHERGFKRGGLIDWRRLEAAAEGLLARVRVHIPPTTRLGDLSLAQRQMVELARLLWLGEQTAEQPLIILDEPTTVLSKEETDTLFGLMEELRQRASVILISHRMSEILQYTDRILVLRDGLDVARYESRQTSEGDLYQVMVGRELAGEYYHESEQTEPEDEPLLRVRGLTKRHVYQNVGFEVRRGEIVSLVGTVGSGKEAICRAVMGIDQPDAGEMEFRGQAFRPRGPLGAVRHRIGYVPEDRRDEGLVLYMDIASNISLSKLDLVTRHGFLSRGAERRLAKDWISRLRIRTSSENALCVNLSGGNQQKVVLAKWLAAQVDLLILDHPTRGIDVGAKEEVYALIRELTRQHIGIILMSDTLEEDIGLANRLLVFKDGRLVKEMASPKGGKPTPLDLIEYIV